MLSEANHPVLLKYKQLDFSLRSLSTGCSASCLVKPACRTRDLQHIHHYQFPLLPIFRLLLNINQTSEIHLNINPAINLKLSLKSVVFHDNSAREGFGTVFHFFTNSGLTFLGK
jgi:hypothetical protein